MEFDNLTIFDEFYLRNKTEKKNFLINIWKAYRLIAKVETINDNKYTFVSPLDLNTASLINPFTNREVKNVYVNLEKIIDRVQEGNYIIFDFDICGSVNEESFIVGGKGYIDVLADYEQIIEAVGANYECIQKLSSGGEEQIFIPFKLYNIFEDLNYKFLEELNEKQDNIHILQDKIDLYKESHEEVKNQLELLKEELEKKKASVKETLNKYKEKEKKKITKQLNNYENKRIVQISVELDKRKKELEMFNNRIDKLRGFGLIDEWEQSGQCNCESKKIDDETLRLDYLQEYLFKEYGLIYSINTIHRFYNMLKTGEMIILCGPPGTGKTSLVNYFGKAIGAETRIIPVQTSWNDNQDILGFYNPIEKFYFSTPFLDSLVEAKRNPEKLYLICLDEMNLARVEYYFSEFLSAMEMEKPMINLYSKFIYEDLRKKAEDIINKYSSIEDIGDRDKAVLDCYNRISMYPAEFYIPENVRFIGTLNADESTVELSPKVIDRSFILEISDYENVAKKSKFKEEDIDTPLELCPSDFTIEHFKSLDEEDNLHIDEIREKLLSVGIRFGRRFHKHMNKFYHTQIWKQKEDFVDYIVSSKILPKVSLYYEDKNDKKYNILQEIGDIISIYPISSSKLEQMIGDSEESGIVTYWR